jgi:hypothetical protein
MIKEGNHTKLWFVRLRDFINPVIFTSNFTARFYLTKTMQLRLCKGLPSYDYFSRDLSYLHVEFS